MTEEEHDPLKLQSLDTPAGRGCSTIFVVLVCLLVLYGAARVLYQAFTK